MGRFLTLIKRELWEHANLWRVPTILLVLTVLANLGFSGAASWLGLAPPEISSGIIGGTLGSLGSIIFFVFSFLVLFYLVDCLYTERKDKSILFWRSLPISDTQAVLAKLCVAAVVIPLIIWLTIIAAQICTLFIQSVAGGGRSTELFSMVDLGAHWINLMFILVLTVLWTLPLLSWFLFCSSWSKRTPFVAALTIPIVFMLLDRIFSFNIGLGGMIAERIPFGLGLLGSGNEKGVLFGLRAIVSSQYNEVELSQFARFFQQMKLWAGLTVAGLFTAATIWIRRWRDDG